MPAGSGSGGTCRRRRWRRGTSFSSSSCCPPHPQVDHVVVIELGLFAAYPQDVRAHVLAEENEFGPVQVAFELQNVHVIAHMFPVVLMRLHERVSRRVQLQTRQEPHSRNVDDLGIGARVGSVVKYDYRILRHQREQLPEGLLEKCHVRILPGITVRPAGIPETWSTDRPTTTYNLSGRWSQGCSNLITVPLARALKYLEVQSIITFPRVIPYLEVSCFPRCETIRSTFLSSLSIVRSLTSGNGQNIQGEVRIVRRVVCPLHILRRIGKDFSLCNPSRRAMSTLSDSIQSGSMSPSTYGASSRETALGIVGVPSATPTSNQSGLSSTTIGGELKQFDTISGCCTKTLRILLWGYLLTSPSISGIELVVKRSEVLQNASGGIRGG